MTDRQREFCRWMAEGADADSAAQKAGYVKTGMGERLLKQLFIQEELAKQKKEKESHTEAEVAADDEILQFLTNMLRGDSEADLRSRMRAAELLGKKFGLFEKSDRDEKESGVMILDDVT